MPRFTRAELESFRDVEVPDLAGPGMRLLFVGINPGLMTAATQIHFGNPGNRFRPALLAAGLLEPLDGGPAGMSEADLATLVAARGRHHQPGVARHRTGRRADQDRAGRGRAEAARSSSRSTVRGWSRCWA